ncbi:MAG: FeoB-associated Cys-rich membrane protein [Tannerellaceae bacterium]|nr:FeoB-associated Cys-rich membrane protein [Tannerellaceae bacterium]
MWQEILVLLIGIATAGYLGYRLVRMLRAPKRPPSSCGGCKGCAVGNKKEHFRF